MSREGRKIILCERCKENEAVCIWDLHGEYYGCNVCEKCCSKLTEERRQICSGKPLRTKADPFFDIKYASLFLLYAFIATLAWSFRAPHINYLKIFELNNFLSFICLTSFGHISALLLSYNKRKRKIHSALAIGLEVLFGVFGACAIFENRFAYDLSSVIIIICLTIILAITIFLLIMQKSRKINKRIPSWLRIMLIMVGFISALVAMFLISIKDMMELNMFGL